MYKGEEGCPGPCKNRLLQVISEAVGATVPKKLMYTQLVAMYDAMVEAFSHNCCLKSNQKVKILQHFLFTNTQSKSFS